MSSEGEIGPRGSRNIRRLPSVFDARREKNSGDDDDGSPKSPRGPRRRLGATSRWEEEEREPFAFEEDGHEMFDIEGLTPVVDQSHPFPQQSVPTASTTEPTAQRTSDPVMGTLGLTAAPQPLSLPTHSAFHKRGLGMRDIVSDESHLWLMHQSCGGPVRVRMFPKGMVEFVEYSKRAAVLPSEQSKSKKSSSRHNAGDGDRASTKSGSSGRRSSSTATMSSSSGSSSSNRHREVHWLDLQTHNTEDIEMLLGMFHLATTTTECVLLQHPVDHVENYPEYGYVLVNIACVAIQPNTSVAMAGKSHLLKRGNGGSGAASTCSNDSFTAADLATSGDSPVVIVSCIVFADWIVTVHREPFEELGDVVKQVHLDFTLKKRSKLRRFGSAAQNAENADGENVPEEATVRRMMRPSWVLSTLVDFVVSNFLPDPTPVMGMVDNVEARVMLLANVTNRQEHHALSRRITWLRRVITRHRRTVNAKEQLLTQLLLPAMRTNFIARRSVDADVYVYCQKQISKVAERINSARDLLQVASSNNVAAGQLRMTRASQALEHRMHLMAHITVVLAPPALIASLWGMNVTVPFFNADYPSIRAFWGIIGVIVLWLMVMLRSLLKIVRTIYESTANAQSTWDTDELFGGTKRKKRSSLKFTA